jgi:uncharacterized protein (TIGR02246 family)
VKRLKWVLLVLAFATTACRSPKAWSEADRAAIVRAGDDWVHAARAGDAESMADLYTQDAVLLLQDAPPVLGRAAIQEWFAHFPSIRAVHLERERIEGHGDLAYVWGLYEMTLSIPGVPEPLHDRGTYVEVWRKQADGAWRIALDMAHSGGARAD